MHYDLLHDVVNGQAKIWYESVSKIAKVQCNWIPKGINIDIIHKHMEELPQVVHVNSERSNERSKDKHVLLHDEPLRVEEMKKWKNALNSTTAPKGVPRTNGN